MSKADEIYHRVRDFEKSHGGARISEWNIRDRILHTDWCCDFWIANDSLDMAFMNKEKAANHLFNHIMKEYCK